MGAIGRPAEGALRQDHARARSVRFPGPAAPNHGTAPAGTGSVARQQNPVNIHIMKSSTQDKAEGSAKNLKGKVKEGVGRAVDNPDMQVEGRGDQGEGKVQKKVGDVKKVFGK